MAFADFTHALDEREGRKLRAAPGAQDRIEHDGNLQAPDRLDQQAHLRRLAEQSIPQLAVCSYNEIAPGIRVETVGVVEG